ncbi:hypothetical protein [Microbacterium allomyrinae]|uniref:Uncharacterized protein n=1 Tax=Microbacterium allomyrinae TaxID=2830666 RepID=A0A9X1S4C6_9MICO|nr:hypothetical protein [Microbacterium allomyrinae]MCC2032865.1 hypothetical protein [Microbacterium allomyrinae]
MQPIFEFIGNYWWLAFPLIGVMGALGSAWERNARGRHKRRIEIMHAKAELKAAQAAARGKAVPAASLPPMTGPLPTTPSLSQGVTDAVATGMAGSTTNSASQRVSQLERLFAAHDAVTARWLEYELDVAKIIAFPAMSDGRQPLTAGFLKAKRIADGLRPASAKARLSKDQLTEYRNAVADFEVAFDVAERDARRLKDSSFTEGERKRLDTAKQLLTVAIDQAATPAERQLAYRRVREELDGLISISDEAIEVLENKVMLEITPGPPASGSGTAPSASVNPTPPAASAPADSAPADPLTMPAAPQHPGTTPPPPPKNATWPVPARGTGDTAPGRVVHPKPHH